MCIKEAAERRASMVASDFEMLGQELWRRQKSAADFFIMFSFINDDNDDEGRR
jgi:hypothetical protein